MGLMRALDKIDLSPHLVYDSIEKVMYEIEKDYMDVFQYITVDEFRKYIRERYYL